MNKNEPMFEYLKSIANFVPLPFWWMSKNKVVLGCNQVCLDAIGASREDEYVGKNAFEIYNDLEIYEQFEKWMDDVLNTGKESQKEHFITDLKTGETKYFSGTFAPLKNADSEIIGLIGTSIDITAEKNAEKESAIAKTIIAEQEKFREFVQQISHDIRSPISTLNMMLKICGEFSELVRDAFKNATVRLDDIATRLAQQYKSDRETVDESNEILVSTALYGILAEKKFEYAEHNVNITSQFVGKGNFAFIWADPVDFKRMLSNLINNAVSAMKNKTGDIAIELKVVDKEVQISISDNGKGMPEHVRKAILNNEMVTYGKEGGTGVGLTHARETIAKYNGRLAIKSEENKGTQMTVTFPKMDAPSWIAGKVELNYGDTVVILDDDESIHNAWDLLFKDHTQHVDVRHYSYGVDAIDFINSLSDKDKTKVYLLTDYELLKQNINGLDVIAKTGIKRGILVTSHHMDKDIQAKAAEYKTRIMPKPLAHEANIMFSKDSKPEQPNLFGDDIDLIATDSEKMQHFKKVDMVILDDDEYVSSNLKLFVLRGKVVDSYLTVDDFFKNVDTYSLDNKMLIDYTFANNPKVNGIDVIKKLLEKGFTNCYLYSGREFDASALPRGVRVILKDKIDEISNLFDDLTEDSPTRDNYVNPRQNELALTSEDSAPPTQNTKYTPPPSTDVKTLARDVTHDLRTPLAGLESIIEYSESLSEEERIALKRLATRFRDITDNITHKYIKPKPEAEREKVILIRNTIEDILQKNNYQTKAFKLTFDCKEQANTVSIKMLAPVFNNMIVDIINMSARSLEGKGLEGKLNIGLNINAEYAVISIEDNAGKFLNPTLIEQINKKETIDADNPDNAHALQLAKIKKTIEGMLGTMVIYFNAGARTKIALRIPTVAAPNWLATQITLRSNDTLLVVTSHSDEFRNWQNKIKKECEQFKLTQMKQIKSFADIITYTEGMAEEQLDRLVVIGSIEELSEYAERLKAYKRPNLIKRTFVTTTNYDDENVSETVTILGAKIIPNGLKAPIKAVFENILEPGSKVVDMVWLDDEKMYIDDMIRKYYFEYKVDAYYDPNTFLDYVIQYPLNTKIFLDHNYYHNDNYKFDVNGISLADKLYKQGYTKLFLISGEMIENKPDYLNVILKTDTHTLRNLDKL